MPGLRKVLFVLAVVGILPVAGATAGTVSISVGSPTGGTATLHVPGVFADGLTVKLGSSLITGGLGTFEAYCVDLQHYAGPSPQTALAASMLNWGPPADPGIVGPGFPGGSLGGGAAAWLYNMYAAGADNTGRAALSLAIWNALYDSDATVLNGIGFWVTSTSSSYTSLANTMLAAYFAAGKPLVDAMWVRTQDGSGHISQDYVGPVPEPASMVLLGTGLLGIAGVVRRRFASRRRKE